MRVSEFWSAMGEEFGDGYSRVIASDLVIDSLGGRTGQHALAAGVPAREVWLAICVAQDVPEARRYGVGLRDPNR